LVERPARVLTLGAAAQDRRVARLQAQGARVRGDVGTALVDDADDAEWHDHALDPEPVRPLPLRARRSDRIAQLDYRVDALGDRLDAPLIEAQPLEARSGEPRRARRRHVALVGGEDRRPKTGDPTAQTPSPAGLRFPPPAEKKKNEHTTNHSQGVRIVS